MIPQLTAVALAAAFATGSAAKADPPPSTTTSTTPSTAPATKPSPAEQGIAQARADIAAARLHIHYFGKPWSADKPLIDDASGLPVEIVEGCVVSDEFVQQTDAYNKTMREAAATRAAPKR